MSFPELFAIAVALAMDAFAVSVCAGCALKRVTAVHFLRLSLTFGFFQFLMPVIGWALGLTVRGFIESWDHWIAFALLAWIGGNMIRGGGDDSEDGESCSVDPTKGRKLLILAVATSIDALARGAFLLAPQHKRMGAVHPDRRGLCRHHGPWPAGGKRARTCGHFWPTRRTCGRLRPYRHRPENPL